MSVKQVTMISLEELMPAKHNYRKFKEVFNFKKIDYRLKVMESDKGQQRIWDGSFIQMFVIPIYGGFE